MSSLGRSIRKLRTNKSHGGQRRGTLAPIRSVVCIGIFSALCTYTLFMVDLSTGNNPQFRAMEDVSSPIYENDRVQGRQTQNDNVQNTALVETETQQHTSDLASAQLEKTVVVGLMVAAQERYYDALQAQSETWLDPIPKERVFVVGPKDESGSRANLPRFVPSPCVDRNLWCKRLQQVSEAHRLLSTGFEFDWFLSGNEDWYVNLSPFLDTFKDKSPNDAVVYSSLGCAQHWEYHESSKGGTLPKPDGWQDHQQCIGLSQKGGICGGSGIVFSRRAVEVLMKDGESALFNRTRALPFHWEDFPQDDDVLSCVVYDFDGQVQLEMYPWSNGDRQSNEMVKCQDCLITAVHAVKFDHHSAADILRMAHELAHK